MSRRPSPLPLVLLGLMTLLSFGGPFAIALVIRGGRSPAWPPDRPVEWWTFGLVTGAVVGLMLACLALALAHGRRAAGSARDGRDGP